MNDFAFEIKINLVENGFIIQYPEVSPNPDEDEEMEVFIATRIEPTKADVIKHVKKVLDLFGYEPKTKK